MKFSKSSVVQGVRVAMVAAAFAWGSMGVSAEMGPEDLLKKVDSWRLPTGGTEIDLTLQSNKGFDGEARDTRVWEYLARNDGSLKSLTDVLEDDMAGTKILGTEEAVWMHVKGNQRSVRITPLQRLAGEASVGDVMNMRWSLDYDARYADEKEGKVGDVATYRLDLTPKREGATYARILLDVSQDEGAPLHANFYMASGKLFKSADFGALEFSPHQGQKVVQDVRFFDEINKGRYTDMKIARVESKSFPTRLFTRASLR